MTYKTILVHCDASPKVGQRLTVAAELAKRHGAHLVGMHARPPLRSADLLRRWLGHGHAVRQPTRRAPTPIRPPRSRPSRRPSRAARSSHEWRVTEGFIDSELVIQARYADLLVVGQTDPDAQTPTPSDLPEAVVLATGRPTLVVPHIGVRAPIGEIGACSAGMPVAKARGRRPMPCRSCAMAQKVVVLVVDPRTSPDGHGAEPGADVALWLARHGVKVTFSATWPPTATWAAVILSRAADIGVDLIVMGVYGHSRVREMVLGGVSRTLLSSMTVPVLISH